MASRIALVNNTESLSQRMARRVRVALGTLRGDAPARRVQLPESPFLDWRFEEAESAIEEALANQTIDTSKHAEQLKPAPGEVRYASPRQNQDPIAVNRAFFQGDHWQQGAGYIGPRPQASEQGFSDTMNEIALIFTSQNAVKEVTTRHAMGVVGKPIRWGFVPRRDTGDFEPTPDEQTLIDQATALMRGWLDARKVSTLLRDAVSTLLLAERASIRLFVPAGLATRLEDGRTVVSAASIEEALSKIWPEHPMPEAATVVTDPDTKLECGIVVFEGEDDSGDSRDGGGTNDAASIEQAALVFLDRDGKTVFRVVRSDTKAANAAQGANATKADELKESTLDLGARIPMIEMHRPAFITPQVQQAQRAMNFALTMVPRNVTTGGFLERLLLDAQQPGYWERDPETGIKTGKWIENPYYVGAGTTNFIQGAEYDETNEKGETVVRHGTPSAIFREPVKPDASLAAKEAHYRSILEETVQLFVVMAGDANASGVSRLEARADYLKTLERTQPEVESAMRFVLETALAMAEAIAGKAGFFTSTLRAQAACKLDAGPLSPAEIAAIESSIGKTISRETAMVLRGIDDVDAEQTRMAADPMSRAALAKAVGDALVSLTTAGVTITGAARFMGLGDEELAELLSADEIDGGDGGGGENSNPGDGNPDDVPAPITDRLRSGAPAGNGGNGGNGNRATRQSSSSGSAAGGQNGGQ